VLGSVSMSERVCVRARGSERASKRETQGERERKGEGEKRTEREGEKERERVCVCDAQALPESTHEQVPRATGKKEMRLQKARATMKNRRYVPRCRGPISVVVYLFISFICLFGLVIDFV